MPRGALLPWPVAEATGKPRFALRGLLPWYNFWDSPTSWNESDWRRYLDSMAAEGLNLLMLHAYDYEPFCAYRYQGRWVGGAPLRTSAQANWGCHAMATGDFGFGTRRLFADRYFGAEIAQDQPSPEVAIEAQQAFLARQLAYAQSLGIRTCLGFEVSGNPLDQQELPWLEARLRHVLQRYPLDYVALWQPEARGVQGCPVPELTSPLGAYCRRWHDTFSYLGKEQRIAEAVRMTLYARAAREIVAALRAQVKLVVAGWGGDQWLHFTDFFPGMDRLLPRDVIFAALDNIRVTPSVSENYAKLQGRQAWAIPWLEYDGDQWVPQPNTAAWAGACRDAYRKGCLGVLGIHWRTRAVEESAAYMARYALGHDESVADFYKRVARDWFGQGLAEEGARVLLDLQALGYRWTGGAGQMECGALRWAPGRDDARLEKLRDCRRRLEGLLDRARRGEG
ncbi:MAG: hypothetical protein J7M26_10285, partial [Armatimonadetes bacterium]|nr:hypothetical protein [Armatimonadota bacterium]